MTNKEYKVNAKKQSHNYCFICQKKNGSWYYDCSSTFVHGRHGNGKPIESHKRREYRGWKYNRKTQWK